MLDLALAAALSGSLSAALFFLVRKIKHRAASTLLCALSLCAILAHLLFLRDSLLAARLLPFSGLILLANPIFPAASTLAALCRRTPLRILLISLGVVALLQPIFVFTPDCRDRSSDGVTLQTSPATCAPAAASTLLRHYGIVATEAEMSRLCLSTKNGTPLLGLYRGLRLKAGRVEILRELSSPAILLVRLEPGDTSDPRYERDWGWTPGVSHTVVFFGFAPDGRAEIGDPAVGREFWSPEDLRILWRGQGLKISR